MTRKRVRRSGGFAVVGLAVLAFDQLTKYVGYLLPRGEFIYPESNPGFTMGVASPPQITAILIATIVLVLFGGASLLLARRGWVPGWVAGLLIGGAASNLIDRIFLGGTVRDFLQVPHVVIFNLADVAVDIGLVAFVVAVLSTIARNDRQSTDRSRETPAA